MRIHRIAQLLLAKGFGNLPRLNPVFWRIQGTGMKGGIADDLANPLNNNNTTALEAVMYAQAEDFSTLALLGAM